MTRRNNERFSFNDRRDLCEQYERWVSEVGGPKAKFCRALDIEQSWFNSQLRHFGFSHLIGKKFGTPPAPQRNASDHDCDGNNDEAFKPKVSDVVHHKKYDGYALTLHVCGAHLHFEELPAASWLAELMRGIDG